MGRIHGTHRFAFPAILIALICASGCRQEGARGITRSDSNWTVGINEPGATPGIDAASVTFITLLAGPPAGVPFVVWSDLPNGGAGRVDAQADGTAYKGDHRATDGRRVEFRAETTDGKTGTITIAEVSYDLAGGALFLVSTQNGPPAVAQVEYDLSTFPKGKDPLIEFAKSNEDIRAFFEKHRKRGQDGKSTSPDER